MTKRSEPNILLDSDVVRHFLNGNCIHKLPAIWFVLLDKIKNELLSSMCPITPVSVWVVAVAGLESA